ncbi:MAG: dihydropyrimidinase [Blautia sp.]|jgi:dihydropyrimidinase
MKQLLKNGVVVSGKNTRCADILIEDGKILRVEQGITDQDAEQYDLSGKLVFPGFIDGHTHFDLEVSGTVTADNFESGSRAAVMGGTTMVIDFATQNKGETLKEALENWHRKADGKCSCDYGFHMAISDWNQEAKAQIQDMIDAGITSFKVYMTYPAMRLNDGEIYEVLKVLREKGCFAGVHCENADLIDARIREEKAAGHFGPDTHPKVRPAEAEAEAVHRLLVLAKEAEAPVMVVHLTCEESYQEIQRARKNGQIVYAETCPQYLLLDDSLYEKPDFEGAKYVCSPPLRKKKDQTVLWKALASGEIQTVATDHCSFTMEQKEMGREDFTKIPNGMPGVENRGPLIHTYGVEEERLTLEQMCRVLSENPAKLYGVYPRKGVIASGSDADLVVIDPKKEGVITAKTQTYNMDYAPFEGTLLHGMVEKVFLRGSLVVENGKLVKEREGIYIARDKNCF